MGRAPARIAAVIHGCCKVSRRLPAPAMDTVRILALAVRPKVKPSMRAAIVIATALGRNIPAVSTGAKPIAGTAAIRITNTPATA